MANIKKAYVEIVELLQANMTATVSEVLDEVVALASAKSGGGGSRSSASHIDADGTVTGIKCFYFGLWMDPKVTEFGAKASSSTKMNSMCKEGVSNWTKQQATARKAKAQLLDDVASGEVDASDLTSKLAEIEEARNTVVEFSGVGYATLEELQEAS